MNIIILIGRLTRDPELKTLQSGSTLANFTLAVDRFKKGEEKTADFFTCTAWGKTAEALCHYSHKGDKISVQGSVQFRQFKDKDGADRIATEVAVDRIEFISDKRAAQTAQQAPAATQEPQEGPQALPFEI